MSRRAWRNIVARCLDTWRGSARRRRNRGHRYAIVPFLGPARDVPAGHRGRAHTNVRRDCRPPAARDRLCDRRAERRQHANGCTAAGTPPMSPGRKLVPAAIAGVVVLAASALAASPPAQPGPGVVADDAAYRVVLPDRVGQVLTQARCVL